MSRTLAIIIPVALLIGGTLMGFFHEEGSGLNQGVWFWTCAAIVIPVAIYGAYLFVIAMINWISEW